MGFDPLVSKRVSLVIVLPIPRIRNAFRDVGVSSMTLHPGYARRDQAPRMDLIINCLPEVTVSSDAPWLQGLATLQIFIEGASRAKAISGDVRWSWGAKAGKHPG
jgi:hypothetical protein